MVQLLAFQCRQPRKSYCCPNNFACGTRFLKSGGLKELTDCREQFYNSACKKDELCSILRSQSRALDDQVEKRKISYHVAGHVVCKCFFRAATGLRRQVFDAAVNQVEGTCHEPREPNLEPRKLIGMSSLTSLEARIVAFLDSYFVGYRVQYSPTTTEKQMLHKTWSKLYEEEFVAHCRRLGEPAGSFSKFCRVRRKYRSKYAVQKTFKYKRKLIVFV